jgi:hypothetical protein
LAHGSQRAGARQQQQQLQQQHVTMGEELFEKQ